MRRYLTIKEVAEIYRVNPITVRRWIKKGQIKAIKPHSKWLIEKDKEIIDEQ